MISEFGRGVFLPCGATGVTVVTETGTLKGGVVSSATTPFDAAPNVRMTVAVFVPSFSAIGSERMVSVIPSGPSVPEDGLTVAQGLSVRAVNGTAGVRPAMKIVCRTDAMLPTSTLVCFRGVSGITVTTTMREYGPRSSLQLLMARTR